MKLLLRRDQRAGDMLDGKVIFVLQLRADMTPEERSAIVKHKLGDTMLYARERVGVQEESVKGRAKAWLKHALNLTIQAKDGDSRLSSVWRSAKSSPRTRPFPAS